MGKRLILGFVFALALAMTTTTAFATGGGPNGCGTNGNNAPSYWGYSRGWDEQLVGYQDYFCHLTRLEGDWEGTGPGGSPQGPAVVIENDGYWHVVTSSTNDVGIAQCEPAYCFVGENSDYEVEWDNQQLNPGTGYYYPHFESAIAMVDPYNGSCDHESSNNGWTGIPGTATGLRARPRTTEAFSCL